MSNEKDTAGLAPTLESEKAAMPLKLDVSVRPIEPKGNLVGFASVKFNDAFVVEDFKVLQNEKGMFVGMPSKPDKNSKTGYRDTAKPITADFRAELTEAVKTAYHAAVEKLQARTTTIEAEEKQSIPKQLAEGKKQVAKNNADHSAPTKKNAGKEER